MRVFGSCQTIVNYSKIVLEEKKSKITFINNNRQNIKKVLIDGCVITSGIRCDYLIIDSNDIEYFVELKGADIDHALEQLEESIKQISDDKYKSKKYSFIISTRCPLTNATIQNHKARFKKIYNSTLNFKNTPCEFNL